MDLLRIFNILNRHKICTNTKFPSIFKLETDNDTKIKLENFNTRLVKINGLLLCYIENPSSNICKLAVQQNGLALKYVKCQSDDIAIEAVKQNILAYKYVKNKNITIYEIICNYNIKICELELSHK